MPALMATTTLSQGCTFSMLAMQVHVSEYAGALFTKLGVEADLEIETLLCVNEEDWSSAFEEMRSERGQSHVPGLCALYVTFPCVVVLSRLQWVQQGWYRSPEQTSWAPVSSLRHAAHCTVPSAPPDVKGNSEAPSKGSATENWARRRSPSNSSRCGITLTRSSKVR